MELVNCIAMARVIICIGFEEVIDSRLIRKLYNHYAAFFYL